MVTAFSKLSDAELLVLVTLLSSATYKAADADLSNELADLYTEAECTLADRDDSSEDDFMASVRQGQHLLLEVRGVMDGLQAR